FVYPCLSWVCITTCYFTFTAFFLSVYYIKYRFRQVFDKMKTYNESASMNSSIAVSVLMLAIHEHNDICQINQRNNHLMRLILFEVYYFGSLIIDLSILQTFYLT